MHTPHTQPVNTPARASASSPSGDYDWQRFGRHGLRAPYSAVIDLPIPTADAVQIWVATVWPDARHAGGWARALWEPDMHIGRGWRLPERLAAGDVLEFGADITHAPVRWYGIMDSYQFDRWMTVQGPYESPAAAYDDAQRLLALERFQPAIKPAQQADRILRPPEPNVGVRSRILHSGITGDGCGVDVWNARCVPGA